MLNIRHRIPLFIAFALALLTLTCNAGRIHYQDLEGHVILVSGDSNAAELTKEIFNEASPEIDLFTAFQFQSAEDNSVHIINTAVGGARITGIAARFENDCINTNPELVIINGGTNDIRHMEITQQMFIENWTSILDTCRERNIRAVILGILPCSECSDTQMRERDRWNDALKVLVGSYDGFVYVEAGVYVGTFRDGGDEENLWDIKAEYDRGDGLHFKRAGSVMIAKAILDALNPDESKE